MKILFPLLLVLAFVSQAHSASYAFSGTLYEPFGNLPVGEPFIGTLTYPDGQADMSPGMPRGDYIASRFTLEIGGQSLVLLGQGTIKVYDDSFYPLDMFDYTAWDLPGSIGGLEMFEVSIWLTDADALALPDTGLPKTLHLADWTHGKLELKSEDGGGLGSENAAKIARGRFDNFVPICDGSDAPPPMPRVFFGCFEIDDAICPSADTVVPIDPCTVEQ